ncbi:MAG: sulfatase-like hydrolase/transferase [Planctomycetota bacterium]|nr:sulfatase-like hydrolase/transferase [Planctomycetota bacterium]
MPTSKPNILILITDQQQHAMMSCAGTSWVYTPHMDRLAAGGTRFTRAYCSNPVCVPSRFSMFTGRMPSAVGMRGNGGPNLHPFTPEHDLTGLGHCLRRGGYTTLYGGKVHWPVKLNPDRLGFTYFCRDERERLAVDAADVIHRQSGQPWAMVASFINPHDICYQAIRADASERQEKHLLERGATEMANLDEALRLPPGVDPEAFMRDSLPPLPDNWEIQADEPPGIEQVLAQRPFKLHARRKWGEREWRMHRWAYARLTERVDRQIGVVLDALDASGQAENTLVIFVSDHGDHAGSHRLEHKTFFYDEAARVPWIMRLPGTIAAGRVEDRCMVATGLDLMATCCEYAGVETPAHCKGVSLRGVAEGRAGAYVREDVYGENAVSRMLCAGDWKYVRYDEGPHAEQLYDLKKDPGETRNAAQDPAAAEILPRLRKRLDEEMALHAGLALGPLVPAASE